MAELTGVDSNMRPGSRERNVTWAGGTVTTANRHGHWAIAVLAQNPTSATLLALDVGFPMTLSLFAVRERERLQ